MDIDNAVFIQRAKMDSFFCQTRQFTHLNVRTADEINILQSSCAQLKQL